MDKKKSGSDRACVKKKRKVISLEQKIDIINRFEQGDSKSKIARYYGLNESTIRQTINVASEIKEKGKLAPLLAPGQTTRNRSPIMIEMERLLSIWIEDCNQKRIPLCTLTIKTKALTLFAVVKENSKTENVSEDVQQVVEGEVNIQSNSSDKQTFHASNGWFERFKNRYAMHRPNIALSGEAASADNEAAKAFPGNLKKIVSDGGYTDQQIFNVDETGLFWKRMPERTFLAKKEKTQPGYKVSKDHITILLGGNAEGDLKLKPMVIYRNKTPRCFGKGFNTESLPVIWRFNKEARVTKVIFEEWFTSYFCPTVKTYCEENNLAFKILLILDNAPGHPPSLSNLNENVKVIFLPPNTISLLQPMDQGTIATFKAYYLRRIFGQAIKVTTGENAISLLDFWKSYNIKQALYNVHESWCEVTASNMRAVWKHILPHCTNDFCCFTYVNTVVADITNIGRQLGFDENEMDNTDVQELLEANLEQLSDSDLVNIDEQRAYEEAEEISEYINIQEKVFTKKEIEGIFNVVEDLKQKIIDADPDFQRGMQICRIIQKGVHPYKLILEEKKKEKSVQTNLLKYFSKK